jgi:hypothetical protein
LREDTPSGMMKKTAVIIVIAHKDELSDSEKASLRQCYTILGTYRIVLVCPEGLNVNVYKSINPQAEICFIDPKWQASYGMFNRLKIEPLLYEKFSGYSHILFYELDAWVFRNELEDWCNAGYDYIGAPWITGIENNVPKFYPVGGNGGLSLRNIQAHLKVLKVYKIMKSPKQIWEYHKKFHSSFHLWIRMPLILLRMLGFQNNSRYVTKKFWGNEDAYWCKIAPKIDLHFEVAPANVCIKFSFEKYAPLLFEMNGNQLPFGCHAYEKHDFSFWKPYIKFN